MVGRPDGSRAGHSGQTWSRSRDCEASISGRVDHLRGLKETVTMGRLIPAGTGMAYYHDFHIAEEVPVAEAEEQEEAHPFLLEKEKGQSG